MTNVKKSQEFVDYSHETKVTKNPILRYVWLGLGLLSAAIGFINFLIPGLPSTVFILIAVYFFARSSPRFYNWLLNNKMFGGLIRDWRAGKGLSLKAKMMAISVIAITITLSIFALDSQLVKMIVALCGVGVSIYLWTRPTKPAKAES
jgi:uncharacterized protein